MTNARLDDIGALVAVGAFADAGALLLDGFPSADLVPVALGLVPGQVRVSRRVDRVTPAAGLSEAAGLVLADRRAWVTSEGPAGSVVCSAGTVELRAADPARAERARVAAEGRAARPVNLGCRVEFGDGTGEWIDPRTGEILDGRTEVVPATRGRITEWSGKSRANMIRKMSATDWRPMLSWSAAPMVTVTYPGPWFAFAPTRRHVGRHLEAFRLAYRRQWCEPAGVKVMGAWKVEYQRRGAPHLHLLLPCPPGLTLAAYREWVADTWHRIVWADRGSDFLRLLQLLGHDSESAAGVYAVHEARHLVAGTAVDEAEGSRMRDPRRIALYFLGHSLSHAADGGKEYQHVLPASYAGRSGRWWGIWGLEDTTAEVHVDAETWWALREELALYAATEGRVAFQGGRMFGGWIAVPDGPALLASIASTLVDDPPGVNYS